MVVQYILIALVAVVASMDEQLFGITMLGRPLFTSLFVGLILGDVQTGCIVGAALESMFMGAIMVGAAVPPEVYASGVLGCAFAIITGAGTAAAVALALPVSVPAKPLRPRDAGCRFVPPACPASEFSGAHAMRCFAHYFKIAWQYLVFKRFSFSRAGLPVLFFRRSLNGGLADWRDVWCRFCICQ